MHPFFLNFPMFRSLCYEELTFHDVAYHDIT